MKNTRPILLTALMVIVVFVVYRQTHPGDKAITPDQRSDLVLQVRSIPVIHSLALGDFVIPPKGAHDVKITLDESRMRNGRLSGYFSTDGGPGIQVMLLDEDQYDQFERNSTPAKYMYLSRTDTKGDIEAAIPHIGTYYLVFDNSSSESSAKVKADVAIHYEIIQVDSGAAQKK